jgi:acyl-CoA synthetase (AMP-forming)/AMP-acid ligase II
VNTANFLSIPATIVPHQEIMVFEGCRQSYEETTTRVRRLAAALAALGIAKGDRVAVLETNSSRAVDMDRWSRASATVCSA